MRLIINDPNQILQTDDLPKELIEIPEWNASVWVRGLTATERDNWEKSFLERRGSQLQTNLERFSNARARLCATCICNEQGERLFKDNQIEALGNKSAQALDRIFKVAQRLSGITKEDVEELAEALKANPNAESSSGSA